MNYQNEPISPSADLPHRKVIRSWLIPLAEKNTFFAIALLILDYVLFFAAIAATLLSESWWLKALFSIISGFIIGRLFIIGHDACHQSLTVHRRLNKWLGRIAFLPSLSPYSLWDVGHNVVHHGFTNLKGMDFVWAPPTKEEYDAMSPKRKWAERLYRSGWGPGFYYLVEIWWKRMMFPRETYMGTKRRIFMLDGLLVSGFALIWAAIVVAVSHSTGQSILAGLFFAWLVPLFFWFCMIGFVVYVHHTHTKVKWHDNRAEWAKAQPFVSTTVHLLFKFKLGALMHHIMEHTAHHVDMSVPLYKLKKAQQKLEDMLPERIIVQNFSWSWYFKTAKACKLYDFKQKCWTDFEGNPSPQVLC